MSEDKDCVAVAYSERFTWLKRMLAQPKSILSDATKLVLVAIWEAMDRRTGITARKYATIASALGMKESGVRACAAKASKAGWLVSEGKGGIRYDEQGVAHGIANRFKLAQPATAIAGNAEPRCYETEGKVLWNADQGAMEMGDTRYGHSDNPLSFPSSSPIDSPDSVEESPPREDVAAQPVSKGGKEEEETHEQEPHTLLSEDKILWAWGSSMPPPEAELENDYRDNRDRASVDWGYEACVVLGYTMGSARAYEERHGHYPFTPVADALGPDKVNAIIAEMADGSMTKRKLAMILGRHGFNPVRADEKEGAANG